MSEEPETQQALNGDQPRIEVVSKDTSQVLIVEDEDEGDESDTYDDFEAEDNRDDDGEEDEDVEEDYDGEGEVDEEKQTNGKNLTALLLGDPNAANADDEEDAEDDKDEDDEDDDEDGDDFFEEEPTEKVQTNGNAAKKRTFDEAEALEDREATAKKVKA